MTHESICLRSESVCRKKVVSNEELAKRLDALERTYEWQIEMILNAIEQLLARRVCRRNQIGFRAKIRKKRKASSKRAKAPDCDP
jgi:hypothetical protein